MQKNKFSIDDTCVLKGVAIILMFMHHLFAFPDRIIEPNFFVPIHTYIHVPLINQDFEFLLGQFGKLCVAIFLFLSGYGTYLSYKSKNTSNEKFVLKKIFRIYKIYWQVFIIFIPIGLIMRKIDFHYVEFACNFFALSSSYNGEAWFLFPFVLLIIFSPYIIKFIDKIKNRLIEVIAVIFISALLYYVYPYIFDIDALKVFKETRFFSKSLLAIQLLPSFLSGIIFAKNDYFSKYWSLIKNKLNLFLASLILMITVFAFRNKGFENFECVYSALFCMGAINCIKYSELLYTILNRIGKYSTYMWFIHSYFCYYYFQSVIYAPRFSFSILIWLLVITYFVSVGIEYFFKLDMKKR